MKLLKGLSPWSSLLKAAFILISFVGVEAQPNQGTIRGATADVQGSLVIDADVALTLPDGTVRTARSNDSGQFSFTNLTPGTYSIRVSKEGFAVFENTNVVVTAGRTTALDVTLGVSIQETQVTVTDEAAVSTDPESAAGAVVLNEQDLEALPDDPDDLEAALRALAGPGSGPEGGEIFIDGFSGGSLPPANTIREVRINSNPSHPNSTASVSAASRSLPNPEPISSAANWKWNSRTATSIHAIRSRPTNRHSGPGNSAEMSAVR